MYWLQRTDLLQSCYLGSLARFINSYGCNFLDLVRAMLVYKPTVSVRNTLCRDCYYQNSSHSLWSSLQRFQSTEKVLAVPFFWVAYNYTMVLQYHDYHLHSSVDVWTSYYHWSIYKWIAHPATKVKPPEWRIGSTKMAAATVVVNCQTDMTLFILILKLFIYSISNSKTNL